MKLDINENWNRWDEKQWLEAFPLLMESLPNLKVLSNSRKTFMETDKLPSPNQVQLIKKMYEEHALQETLEDNIKRTQIVMEENKHVFDVDLSPIADQVKTFELALATTDFTPGKIDLFNYYFKKMQLGTFHLPKHFEDEFYAHYGSKLNLEKKEKDTTTNVETMPTSQRMAEFELVFGDD